MDFRHRRLDTQRGKDVFSPTPHLIFLLEVFGYFLCVSYKQDTQNNLNVQQNFKCKHNLSNGSEQTPCWQPGSRISDETTSAQGVSLFAKTGQLTHKTTELIVPDTQLQRLELPPPENSQKPARLFFFDEANVSWCPKTGRIYREQGSEYKVNTPGKNQRKYLIGSLEYPSGDGLYEIYANKTHLQMKTHWQNLMEMYPDEMLFIVRDNASSHTTAKLDDFLSHHKDRLRLGFSDADL